MQISMSGPVFNSKSMTFQGMCLGMRTQISTDTSRSKRLKKNMVGSTGTRLQCRFFPRTDPNIYGGKLNKEIKLSAKRRGHVFV